MSLPSVSLVTSILSDVSVATQAFLPLLCAWAILSHHFIFWLPHGEWDPSSMTRDRTCTPCIGSMESYPLDFQQSPPPLLSTHSNSKMSLWHSTQLDLAFLSARLSHIWCRDHLTLIVTMDTAVAAPRTPTFFCLVFWFLCFSQLGWVLFWLHHEAYRILISQLGIKTRPPAAQEGVLITGLPGSYPFGFKWGFLANHFNSSIYYFLEVALEIAVCILWDQAPGNADLVHIQPPILFPPAVYTYYGYLTTQC